MIFLLSIFGHINNLLYSIIWRTPYFICLYNSFTVSNFVLSDINWYSLPGTLAVLILN